MRNILSPILILIFILVYLFSMLIGLFPSFEKYIIAAISGLSAVLGTCVASFVPVHYAETSRNKQYITNAQNVMLLLSKQVGEYLRIKQYFNAGGSIPTPLLGTEHIWKLSKEELLALNNNRKQEMQDILFGVSYFSSKFDHLVSCVQAFAEVDVAKLRDKQGDIQKAITEVKVEPVMSLYSYLSRKHKKTYFEKPPL